MNMNLSDFEYNLMVLIFLIVGVICVSLPYKIQAFALKLSAQGWAKYILNFIKTRSYIVTLRVIGVFSIGVFLFLLVGMITFSK